MGYLYMLTITVCLFGSGWEVYLKVVVLRFNCLNQFQQPAFRMLVQCWEMLQWVKASAAKLDDLMLVYILTNSM